MGEPANKNKTQESEIVLLRPFVSYRPLAIPGFEVLPPSKGSVIDQAPAILNYLDSSLPPAHRGKTRLSVSLDAGELSDKSFSQTLLKKITLQNIEPSRLWLEVCESDVLNETAWRKVIPELASSGFGVVVKRFIADHAGFDVLASPDIAVIKVAPQVVAGLPDSVLARRFLKGLQALASAVNKQLIVDGVRTLDQALWLEAMGYKMLQGAFYGPAIPTHQACHFVLEGRHCVAPAILRPVKR